MGKSVRATYPATTDRQPPAVSATTSDMVSLDSELLRAMVDNAADGIIAIDRRGCVQMMNPAAERLFGYRTDEVLGRNVSIIELFQYPTVSGLAAHLGSAPTKTAGAAHPAKRNRNLSAGRRTLMRRRKSRG